MGLTRRIAQDRATLGHHRGHQRVLGAGDAGLVEKDVGAGEGLGLELVAVAHRDGGAELLEREEMGVHAAPADHVTTRRRQRDRAEPGEHRPREQDGRADLGAESRVERLGTHRVGVHLHRVRRRPLGRGAEVLEHREHRFDVANAGDVVQLDDAVGEQGGGEDRERRVLVAGRTHGAAQRTTAANEKAWRHGQTCRGRLHASSGARACGGPPTPLFSRMRDARRGPPGSSDG